MDFQFENRSPPQVDVCPKQEASETDRVLQALLESRGSRERSSIHHLANALNESLRIAVVASLEFD